MAEPTVVAQGPAGELLVGYRDADAGWRFDPGLGWIPTSIGAQLRRGPWLEPTATLPATLPADFPGGDEPPDLRAARAEAAAKRLAARKR